MMTVYAIQRHTWELDECSTKLFETEESALKAFQEYLLEIHDDIVNVYISTTRHLFFEGRCGENIHIQVEPLEIHK